MPKEQKDTEGRGLTGCLQYKLAGTLTKPASNPTYYTDLMKEIEKAPTRSWLEATINRWKGFIRFQ